MRKLLFAAVAGAAFLVALTAGSLAVAGGGNGGSKISAKLIGYNEVPSISTAARGHFKAKINKSANTIDYTLTYSGLEGGAATAAHIHLGQQHTNGGVSAFLCAGAEAACPATAGTVSGTITAAEVVGPGPQGIQASEMAELIRAIKAGAAYVNVHSAGAAVPAGGYPNGEIRGQIHGGGDDDDD
jgi:CHRD domain